jgi:tetratricopeptide (TPR) repeat protein
MRDLSKMSFYFLFLILFASVSSNMLGWTTVPHEQLAHSQMGVINNSNVSAAQINSSSSSSIGNNNSSFNQGYALFEEGKYEEALTFYDKALAINPNFTSTLFNKGLALLNLNRSEEAITFFDKVLAQEPENNNTLYIKAVALHNLGEMKKQLAFLIWC